MLLAGCGGERGGTAGPAATATATATTPARSASLPALCGPLKATVTGRVATPAATELSGLVRSRSQPRVLWAHNDSGDDARVFALTAGGRLLAEIAVSGAENVDWEDIAIGPAPGGGDALYVADIGDNDAQRDEVVVLRVPEPDLAAAVAPATRPAERLALRYPDGAHDAEALIVDPRSGALIVVTKSLGGESGVFSATAPAAGQTTALRRRGQLDLGVGEAVTAGDVSADGRTIVLRTYDSAFVWRRGVTESVAQALRRPPCSPRDDALLAEGQGETLALTADGRAFYTVPEGSRPTIRRHAPAR
ncbi:MAG TPA: hypothetical protein VMY78_15340 [Solirubrobacteraceae bacterium]|nr:hypothetical protein [Solirubrobacteraceae bacterium]